MTAKAVATAVPASDCLHGTALLAHTTCCNAADAAAANAAPPSFDIPTLPPHANTMALPPAASPVAAASRTPPHQPADTSVEPQPSVGAAGEAAIMAQEDMPLLPGAVV